MNFAVLLSGGIGSRIKSDIPKQYIKISGHMILIHTLGALVRSSNVDYMYIVANPEWHEAIINDAKDDSLDIAKILGFSEPGANRQGSILNALRDIKVYIEENKSMDDTEEHSVLIHDAVRPFISDEMINSCYNSLAGFDGVMPVIPMKDTVYSSKDGLKVDGLLNRSEIFAGQAPELFLLEPYFQANIALLPDKINTINGATEPAIISGLNIRMIPGDEHNFKITTDNDLERCRELLMENKVF